MKDAEYFLKLYNFVIEKEREVDKEVDNGNQFSPMSSDSNCIDLTNSSKEDMYQHLLNGNKYKIHNFKIRLLRHETFFDNKLKPYYTITIFEKLDNDLAMVNAIIDYRFKYTDIKNQFAWSGYSKALTGQEVVEIFKYLQGIEKLKAFM